MTGAIPMCASCVRFQPFEGDRGSWCAAFPDGIPDEIYFGGFDHRLPFPGDHGVRYEQDPGPRGKALDGYTPMAERPA